MGFPKALWAGDSKVLPEGAEVEILAGDDVGDIPARWARWVRWWPEGSDFPRYRSCDLGDLDFKERPSD